MKYKVGDRVKIKSLDWYNKNKNVLGNIECGDAIMNIKKSQFCGKIVTISSVSDVTDTYKIEEDNGQNIWTDEMIEGLVEEEEIEFTEEDKYWCDIMSESDPTTYVLPDGYIFKDENGNVINATKIVLEKKKKEYPKTYEECAEIIAELTGSDCNPKGCMGYMSVQLTALQKLFICRDAYWKIAGEEMGLGKPWEPDYKKERYVISRYIDEIVKGYRQAGLIEHFILEFPTEEMRDAFKKNFDPDIEICKELL